MRTDRTLDLVYLLTKNDLNSILHKKRDCSENIDEPGCTRLFFLLDNPCIDIDIVDSVVVVITVYSIRL